MKPAIATIVARNYLSFARVLADSLARHHPRLAFFVVVVDGRGAELDGCGVVIPFSALSMPLIDGRRWSRQELAVAAKPYLIRYLLDRGFSPAVFIDPDTLVVGDLDAVLAEVAHHPLTLVPHLLEPPTGPDRVDRELVLLRAGTFNGGLVAAGGPQARPLLAWWIDRVLAEGTSAIERGVYYDQRWLDLLPTLFEDIHVLRDPGCNVAYWNLPERQVAIDGDRVSVNDGAARFFHFSGFDPESPELASRHVPGLRADAFGPAAVLFQRYAALLLAAGYAETHRLPWERLSH